jgi:hypothetical protein
LPGPFDAVLQATRRKTSPQATVGNILLCDVECESIGHLTKCSSAESERIKGAAGGMAWRIPLDARDAPHSITRNVHPRRCKATRHRSSVQGLAQEFARPFSAIVAMARK